MRTRIAAALAATAASLAMLGPAAAAGPCSGTYDTNCDTYVCNRTMCLEVRCEVWIDVVPDRQSGCIG